MKTLKEESNLGRASATDFDEITAVWEASVRATHHILKEEDILFYRPLIRNEYLYAVELFCFRDEHNRIIGFLGTSENKIEMLFIHPDCRGKGVGRALLQYAIDTLGSCKVDVNEQNEQAIGFYKYFGFKVVGRTELDGLRKPYPILNLELHV
ncbi:putative acetyltransferase [Pontibacter ummariensis]|uniref:Putative acetyltransferase n=1 Tax=Pontibacter ummariensis TaxID=1610492 RepID=A0A239GRK7_9BACT|nr:GNAT family N-acetyltransferase [Pontibacter ummariensis]PRY11360.1 putative acetyltransferase [Pontibacter ummariensis]SNS70714.1 putative acetyltransferase [Pontibacter ummariensis]